MKKILSILGAITLVGTSTTSLVACNKPQYSEDELKKEKEENKIKTNNQEIRDNLEWIAPQEKPFDKIDNKYYYVVWRSSDTGNNWRIVKFLNDTNSKKELDSYGRYKLIFKEYSPFYDFTLLIRGERGDADHTWKDNNYKYFKAVYRWNLLDKPEPELSIDSNDNIEVKEE